jgi:2-methylisocitrate lyase-like PEP mutase family enzyme
VYLRSTSATDTEKFDEAALRGKAYLEAGADCFYPIALGDLNTLERLREAIRAPINVLAPRCRATLRELEDAGIARLSLGPALMRAALTVMRKIAVELQSYGSFEAFTRDVIPTSDIRAYLSKEPMK